MLKVVGGLVVYGFALLGVGVYIQHVYGKRLR